MSNSRKLFASFTALIRHYEACTVDATHMECGLFYFDCARKHVMSDAPEYLPGEVSRLFSRDLVSGKIAFATIRRRLLQAEQDGRIIWRPEEGRRSWSALSELLTHHGYQNSFGGATIGCTGQAIEELVRAAGCSLDVIWF